MILTIALFLFLTAAAISDCTTRKIPNQLSVLMALSGLVLSAISSRSLPLSSFLGLGVGLAIGVLIWLLGGFKAGDAKLIAASGAFTGIYSLLSILAWSFVCAAAFGIIYLIYKHEFLVRMKRLWQHVKGIFLQGKFSTYSPNQTKEKGIPFAIFLLSGAVIAQFAPVF